MDQFVVFFTTVSSSQFCISDILPTSMHALLQTSKFICSRPGLAVSDDQREALVEINSKSFILELEGKLIQLND